ncbi:hypothetical protein [Tetragenococcus halophilus]|uniref:hypothetical protein n=1 Tax=Tetragenococcus halophilus TaxID=51669 RepID=UPI00209A83D5|nr:hypothetical protein [Tetragenococcus halophilus]MCO8286652.1 hypothetical protein [Tetragenococcus halophilus]
MGEMTEMILNGFLCEQCGAWLEDREEDGYPRKCEECEKENDTKKTDRSPANQSIPKTSKENYTMFGSEIKHYYTDTGVLIDDVDLIFELTYRPYEATQGQERTYIVSQQDIADVIENNGLEHLQHVEPIAFGKEYIEMLQDEGGRL